VPPLLSPSPIPHPSQEDSDDRYAAVRPPTEADTNHLIAERGETRARARAGIAFPNDFRRDSVAEDLHLAYGEHAPEWFDAHPVKVTIAAA